MLIKKQTALSCVSLIALATAFSGSAVMAQNETIKISVEAQPIELALNSLAQQLGKQIVISTKDAKGLQVKSITGVYSDKEILNILLAGTGLKYKYINAQTIAVYSGDSEGTSGFQRISYAAGENYEANLGVMAEEDGGNTDSFAFEEILVTATRRSTSIQSTGLSVSAFSGEGLDKNGYNSIGQFIDMVPGITAASQGPTSARITIRNIATSTQEAGSPTTATYFDDFALPSSDLGNAASSLRLVDMQRVEVLKGPQGTLFGRSAMGGIIRYVSNKPNTEKTEGGINVYTAGVTDGGTSYGGHGYMNLPLSDTLAVRAVGYYYSNAGFLDNVELGLKDTNKEETKGGRIAVHWDASEDFSVDLTYLNQSTDGAHGWLTTTYDPGDLDVAFDEGPDIPFDLDARTYVAGIPLEMKVTSEIINLKLGYDFDSFTAIIQASRVKDKFTFSFDQRPFLGLKSGCVCQRPDADNPPDGVESNVVEFRLVSSGDDEQLIDWIIGGYIEDTNIEGAQVIFLEGPIAPLFPDPLIIDATWENSENEEAVYGELGFNFTKDSKLTVGYRRSHVEFSSVATKSGGFFLADPFTQSQLNEVFGTSENVNTYKILLEHSFNDDFFTYASATSGYRRGGFNQPSLNSDFSEFDSDSLWNYEVGVKSTWMDGRVVANISAYLIDYSDIQLVIQDPVTFVRATQNAGDARIEGVEVLLAVQITDYLDVSFAGALSDAKMKGDVAGTEVFDFGIFDFIPNSGISKGDKLPGSARENFTIQANWDQPMSEGYDIFGNITYKYVGKRNNGFNLVRDPEINASYEIVDARFGIRSDAGYSVSLYAHNLFDEKVAFFIDRQGPTFESVPTNRPRTLGINVIYDF